METSRFSTQPTNSYSRSRIAEGAEPVSSDRPVERSSGHRSPQQYGNAGPQRAKKLPYSKTSTILNSRSAPSDPQLNRRGTADSKSTDSLSPASGSRGKQNPDKVIPRATQQPQINSLTPVRLPVGTSTGTDATIKRVLTPDAAGQIHEEELQYAIVVHLLEHSKAGAGNEFERIFGAKIGTGSPPIGTEDAVKSALAQLVASGNLDLKTAEQINGASFEAAQLDGYKHLLFDGKAGPNDATIAVLGIDEAAALAHAGIKKMEQADSGVFSRSLTATSNGVLNLADLKESLELKGSGDLTGSAAAGATSAVDPKGFLWKPISANNGNLVVLLPKSLTGKVTSCAVYRDLPPTQDNLIERGRFSGDQSNGDRSHFRFNHPGSYFPQKCFVVAVTNQGAEVAFEIADSGMRNTV